MKYYPLIKVCELQTLCGKYPRADFACEKFPIYCLQYDFPSGKAFASRELMAGKMAALITSIVTLFSYFPEENVE